MIVLDTSLSKRVNKYQEAYIKERLTDFMQVGRGKPTNAVCGSFKTAFACECGVSQKIIKNSCNHLSCCECYKTACSSRSEKIALRMFGISNLINNRLFHLSINPRRRQYWIILSDPFKFMKDVLYPIINRHFKGAFILFHLYRLGVEPSLYISPHFHLILATEQKIKLIPGKKLFKKYKMIFKNHGELFTFDDVKKVAYYQLSHSALQVGKQAYRYIGKYSNSKYRLQYAKFTEVPLECESCEGLLYEIDGFEITKYHYNSVASRSIFAYQSIINQEGAKTQFTLIDFKHDIEAYKIVDKLKIHTLNFDSYAIEKLFDSVMYQET